RPGEYPFLVASVPMFVAKAAVRPVAPGGAADLGRFEGVADGVASYRAPVDPVARGQIEGAVRQIDDLARRDPAVLADGKMAEMRRDLKDLLDRGVPVKVDVEDGVLRESGAAGPMTTRLSKIQWPDRVDQREFAVDGTTWDDQSADPTLGDPAARQDWVMLWHTLAMDPATGRGDPDGRLLDLRTGRMRRIPFDGEASVPGCFLKGRDKVVVTGMTGGRFGLYEIDLKSGRNRPLGAEALAGTIAMGPVLSPDGRTLAVAATDARAGPGQLRVFLIDVESGRARALGEPLDCTPPSWTPDGDGLVLSSRRTAGPDQPPESTICRMDLTGKLTPLRPGDRALVLVDGRILYQVSGPDGRGRQWMTCDRGGKDERAFGPGLDRFGFVAPAPDGKRVLMMRYDAGRGPTPYVFRIGEAPGRPAVDLPGLWGSPQWR
ncbi:MAG TPA: hypothetical protein VF796_03480, partial [Humisphaera sp.]